MDADKELRGAVVVDRPAHGCPCDWLQRAGRGKGEATGALLPAGGDAERGADAGRGDYAEGAAQAPAAHPLHGIGRDQEYCGLPDNKHRRNTICHSLIGRFARNFI